VGQLRTFARGLCSGLALSAVPSAALAFTVAIAAGAQEIYLQVGVGGFNGNLITGGTPGNNPFINSVTVNVPAAVVGNGAAQAMGTDSSVGASSYDGFVFCTPNVQLYIGGFYRRPGNANFTATITATVPAALVNASGDKISFANISWTTGGNGDNGGEPFPAGSFVAGGTQTVGTMAHNTWNESCWTFSYSNSAVPPQGTYTGQVVYTMTTP
jgi:hypothetical protein